MTGLRRGLDAWSAMALVIGTIIGTGVFLKAAVMAQRAGSPTWVLLAWAIGGALSIAGALSYAELGAMFPEAGGEYAFLRESWGRAVAFLYGWTRFWIGSPGSIAAYAVGAVTFLSGAIDVAHPGLAAIGLIATFTAINCLSVVVGGRLGAALTLLKVALIIGLAIGALLFADGGGWHHLGEHDARGGAFPGWGPLGLTVLAALWAYDGWNNLPMAAGEVRDPGRNLPRAIVGGTLVVLVIYGAVNLGYFHALPFAEVAGSSASPGEGSVAGRVAATFLGDTAQGLLAFAMVVSALSAMSGSILTGARVPFAMAADGVAPRRLAHVSQRTRVPVVAIVIQGAWACVLAQSGRFDWLTESVVFASWLFYALCAGAVILLRRRRPDHPRPFRVPGYPVVPALFVVLSALLLVNTVANDPRTSASGLVIIAVGAIVYAVALRRR